MEPLTKEDRAELRRLYKPGDIMTRLLDALDAAEGERDNLRSHHYKWLSWQCEAERELDDLRQRLRESEGQAAVYRALLERRAYSDGHYRAECSKFWCHPECKAIKAALSTPTPPLWDLLQRLLRALDAVGAVRLPDG